MNNLVHDKGLRFRQSNRFAVAVAWLVIFIGLVSLTGWITGAIWLTRFADTQVPIAPITILLFVICGLALLALIRFQKTSKIVSCSCCLPLWLCSFQGFWLLRE